MYILQKLRSIKTRSIMTSSCINNTQHKDTQNVQKINMINLISYLNYKIQENKSNHLTFSQVAGYNFTASSYDFIEG